MKDKSYKRHLAKTVTWRLLATLDTVLLSWIITGNPVLGLKIGMIEVFTKMIFYYVHERVWFKIKLSKKGRFIKSKNRHLVKTITWRIIGTIDTMLIAWILTGNPLIGLKIGLVEVITKMILYYFHERIWYKIDFGIVNR